ncbi:MAG TPA: HET-C-related protein, partial [Chloroflexota bacterium]|nr:HET-C-related protein [Chloroflexota bacterium]
MSAQRAEGLEAPGLDVLVQRVAAGASASGRIKPGTLTPSAILSLQRTAGNQAVNRLLHSYTVGETRAGTDAAAAASANHSHRTGRALASPAPLRRQRAGVPMQRYQAGERGHGGIEQEGLRAAGFGGDMASGDIGKVYFGNWMRDFSQTSGDPNSRSGKLILKLLNILSEGEFGRPLDPSQLGGYMPSEHLDNPAGGGSAEDPGANPADLAKAEATLSPDQKAALKREHDPAFKKMIEDAAKGSGLPDYIERGKQHSKDMLARAIDAGDTDEGKMDLGNALHGVEDYFSHSNFTEVALAVLAKEGNQAAQKVLDEAKSEGGGFDATTAGGTDAKGRPGIITGTYGDESHSANKVVSLIEQLKSEVLTGSLRMAFIKGSAIVSGQSLGAEGKSALGTVGKGVGEAAGAVGGGVEGTMGGIARGFEEGHGFFGTIGSMISDGAHGMVSGGEEGAVSGGKTGEKAGGAVGEAV